MDVLTNEKPQPTDDPKWKGMIWPTLRKMLQIIPSSLHRSYVKYLLKLILHKYIYEKDLLM